MFVKARREATQHHNVRLSVASKIHELRVISQCDVGSDSNSFDGGELYFHLLTTIGLLCWDWAEVTFVEPPVSLFCEDARDAFPMQVRPTVAVAIQTSREVLETFSIYRLHRFL